LDELWSTNHRVYAANVCQPKINSARDLRQLYTSIANISRTDTAIDKLKTALSTVIGPTFDKKLRELWSTNQRVYAANVCSDKINSGACGVG